MAADALIPERDVDAPSTLSSRLRSRTRCIDSRASAEHRVVEYFLALGIADESRVVALASEIVSGLPAAIPEAELAERAVTEAQIRFDAWRSDVFEEAESEIHPLWLRTFLAAHPGVFLGDPASARERARDFGDPRSGKAPTRRSFREQSLVSAGWPRWAKGLAAPLVTSGILVALAARAIGDAAITDPRVVAFLLLYGFLSFCGAVGLTTAVRGLRRDRPRREDPPASLTAALPRTALVMPVYHESPEHVFAALLAMRESLARVAGGESVEVFVLSDSREPGHIAEEERAFRRTAALGDPRIPIYYRRRTRNEHQKAGNLAEFFERFGHRYTYAVVLDADSIMHGETIVAMIRRMEASPELGLLQAPLVLHGARTVFARSHQLAASVYGPVFVRGLAAWAGEHGNYYGHNAIVRVRAFLECCALPRLRGEPPLGGNILSHDFVEAALLCRAGYQVRTATDLVGSYEELPATVVEYVARDRRWCQGNLQHLRIAFADGLRPMSRLHMLLGVAAYLAGPAWLVFVGLGAQLAHERGGPLVAPELSVALSVVAVLMLVGPRLVGLWDTIRSPRARAAHGGTMRLASSVFVETFTSVVLAPILMLHHARIIASVVLGDAVSWGNRSRHAGTALSDVIRAELPTTALGVATGAFLSVRAPELLPWLAPVYLPWVLAIPLVLAVSSEWIGDLVRAIGLYAVPTEVEGDATLERADELRAYTEGDSAARFRDLVLDPVLLAAKLAAIDASATPPDAALLERLVERALRMGPAGLTEDEQATLFRDAAIMKRLHREAWRRWPVESWSQGREKPHLPLEAPVVG